MTILMATSSQTENRGEGNLLIAVPSENIVIQLLRIRSEPQKTQKGSTLTFALFCLFFYGQKRARPKTLAIKAASLTVWDETTYIIALPLFTATALQTSTFYLVLSDCSDLFKSGYTQSGVYSVNPDGKGSFNVYCDMRTDGGGWTVFQRRQDGSVDFYRGWNDYKSGFGQLTAEFWLGNDKIHRLTAARPTTLRVELEDWNAVKVYAKYGKFNIGDEQGIYRLEVGSYSGTAGDSLAYHNNMAFSTKDRDNDRWGTNCATLFTGAWWYDDCLNSNLNGKYLGRKSGNGGARWIRFRGSLSLKFTEMKLRPSSQKESQLHDFLNLIFQYNIFFKKL